MAAAAKVQRASFDERLPWLAGLHTPAEDEAFFRDVVHARCSVWGAEADGTLVAIIAFREGWIDQLYVLPGWHRQGIGHALLERAKAGSAGLQLYAFKRNHGARAFYEARGFVVVAESDGSGNEEREPDVLYRWTPVTPPGR